MRFSGKVHPIVEPLASDPVRRIRIPIERPSDGTICGGCGGPGKVVQGVYGQRPPQVVECSPCAGTGRSTDDPCAIGLVVPDDVGHPSHVEVPDMAGCVLDRETIRMIEVMATSECRWRGFDCTVRVRYAPLPYRD